MTEKYDVAVVGATSAVGEVIVELLQERNFPIGKIHLLADGDVAGARIEFNGSYVVVNDVADFDFSQVQIALFAAGERAAENYVQVAADSGCVVIDSSRQFRLQEDVPLVVAGVNDQELSGYSKRCIISSPAGAVTLMTTALKPIADQVGIERINVCSYQAVSDMGRAGVETLASQTASLLNMKDIKAGAFSKQMAFNVIPQIGLIDENGYSEEEYCLVREGQRILGQSQLSIASTAVWVPVFFAHSLALHIETSKPISAVQACEIFDQIEGVELINEPSSGDFPTPVTDGAGSDEIYIGRVRKDISSPKGLNLWLVGDNVRRGVALNSVQLAEILIKNYLSQ